MRKINYYRVKLMLHRKLGKKNELQITQETSSTSSSQEHSQNSLPYLSNFMRLIADKNDIDQTLQCLVDQMRDFVFNFKDSETQ